MNVLCLRLAMVYLVLSCSFVMERNKRGQVSFHVNKKDT
jgi:hypothetical protein